MLSVLCTIDVFLLMRMLRLLRWGTEWLSLKRKWMERTMIAGYGASFIVNAVLLFLHSRFSRGAQGAWMTFSIVLYLLVCGLMWRQQKRPEVERVRRLCSLIGILERTWCVFLTALFSLIEVAPPLRWFDLCVPLWFGFYAAFQYAISLPEDGERGRRRKLALAKLKELFGTSWVTAPVPQPQ